MISLPVARSVQNFVSVMVNIEIIVGHQEFEGSWDPEPITQPESQQPTQTRTTTPPRPAKRCNGPIEFLSNQEEAEDHTADSPLTTRSGRLRGPPARYYSVTFNDVWTLNEEGATEDNTLLNMTRKEKKY